MFIVYLTTAYDDGLLSELRDNKFFLQEVLSAVFYGYVHQ